MSAPLASLEEHLLKLLLRKVDEHLLHLQRARRLHELRVDCGDMIAVSQAGWMDVFESQADAELTDLCTRLIVQCGGRFDNVDRRVDLRG